MNAYETIRQYEAKKEESLRQYERLTEAEDRYQKAESPFREALGVLEGEKDEAIERLYIAAKSNKEFTIDDLILHRIESVLTHYEGAGSAGDYSNPTNQQDTKQDLNQPIQSEGATAEKAVSMASGKA